LCGAKINTALQPKAKSTTRINKRFGLGFFIIYGLTSINIEASPKAPSAQFAPAFAIFTIVFNAISLALLG
jgi:hypothetical protein